MLPSIVGGLTAAVAAGAVIVDHGLHRRSSRVLDRSIYRGPGKRRSVALTFDDGPSPQTPALLAMLRRHGIRATFFQSGIQMERYPDIARQVQAEGHEIGSHAWSHIRLSPHLRSGLHFPTPQFTYREVARTQRQMTALYGEAPRLFRPPYGDRWIVLDAVIRRLGLRSIHWSVLGHDWEWPASRIAKHVLAHLGPGSIICLHDGRDVHPTADLTEMLAALQIIVPELLRQGYRFETVSELLVPEPARVSAKALQNVRTVR